LRPAVDSVLHFKSVTGAELDVMGRFDLSEPMAVIRGEFDAGLWNALRHIDGSIHFFSRGGPSPSPLDDETLELYANIGAKVIAAAELLDART
jgi:hypothetical protein